MDKLNISKSSRIRELDIHFDFHGMKIDVEWYRFKWKSEVSHTFWHAHSKIEIHYILKGSLIVETEQKTIHVGEGEALVIASNRSHRLMNGCDQCSLRVVINLSLSSSGNHPESDELVARIENPPLQSVKLPAYASQVLLYSIDETQSNEFGYSSIIEANLLIFLFLLGRELGGKDIERDDEIRVKKTLMDLRMESIVSYLNHHAYEQLNVEQLAGILNLSVSQLERTVKYCIQKTPLKLIQEVKIEKARELLKNPDLSIGAIADMLRFSNEYHFNRIFKSIEGMPPGKYRLGLCQK